ncbi:phosphoglucomutase/phosphomannomutase alpha/beta/alpha domain I [Thecamonas trahens ATCC 50062]|uniref:phosphoglucomutase (alpha-D-glucose-1,6-bisphosphate-dependent) n=1 Tax=Thecamonas trahens ATCC 50062 TaxID=461836 RepID=A0A0L0DB75_THETB|nr:phosphoglucomutase/phosphomannomutase alpha/beta/alpha domain I [Thecamonas trahens ATCC 50062]KNC49567.1 phosphoglucomutase/phosphomannomutase alpha/beta/alpha domain I [Thecamonas trahens ATCC 50062]|eukprot:XP_013757676.1 phosphoglucomutase/phosphomannomutase alpha/beta/alpha domain I [Thecamonas trahens ATCC 50062]
MYRAQFPFPPYFPYGTPPALFAHPSPLPASPAAMNLASPLPSSGWYSPSPALSSAPVGAAYGFGMPSPARPAAYPSPLVAMSFSPAQPGPPAFHPPAYSPLAAYSPFARRAHHMPPPPSSPSMRGLRSRAAAGAARASAAAAANGISMSAITPQIRPRPAFTISRLETAAYEGQKPGTSGLRKKVAVMQQPNYVANFVQAIFDAVDDLAGATLVVGGDGRFYNDVVIQLIVRMAAANGVGKLIVGQNGILSTPAVSALVRDFGAAGGIILTASHNPGGPDGDLGIKYNIGNGGPAPDAVTAAIYDATKSISRILTADDIDDIALATPARYTFAGSDFEVQVVDSVANYVDNMKRIFDFPAISSLLTSGSFSMVFDAMHGVTGPYATAVLVDELGAPPSSVINGTPLPDFGGGHPDPNLTYAHDLVELMNSGKYDFGAASDGDGDRNMVLGNQFFVNPSDSVAIIAAHANDTIPFFARSPLTGLARSMPTSQALDRVAAHLGLELYETPTGWKYFGSLMDAGLISICGEESFGQSSVHIREKDGLWAVLAWLSILAANPGSSVEDICTRHWASYGRNYFTRYDFEEVDSDGAAELMARLVRKLDSWVGGKLDAGYVVRHADEFAYVDPVNGARASNQGIRFLFDDGSRIVFRLSGTGSSGATIRVYIEQYEPDASEASTPASEKLAPLVNLALSMSRMEEYTGRTEPTVIT